MDESGDLDVTHWVTQVIYLFSALCLIAMSFLIFGATIARYFFNNPPFWGEEIAVLLFVWMGFVGAGMAIVSGWNVRVDSLRKVISRRASLACEAAMHVIVVAFLALMLWHSWDVVDLSLYGKLEATRWPAVVMTAALPTGLAIMLGYQLVLLRRVVRGLRAREGS
jgi:TRAP-type C4-dicarboxylate transport system permease small subunit